MFRDFGRVRRKSNYRPAGPYFASVSHWSSGLGLMNGGPGVMFVAGVWILERYRILELLFPSVT